MISLLDVGKLCLLNEDGVVVDCDVGFVVFVDGMGGYWVGEVVVCLVLESFV